jgi:hypothetical protein
MARKNAFRVDVKGVKEALDRVGKARTQLAQRIGKEVTNASMRVVNDAKEGAPIKDGFLKNSIDILETKPFWRLIGSLLPYAQRQEYEHASRKGFFRKALYKERNVFRANLAKIIREVDGK